MFIPLIELFHQRELEDAEGEARGKMGGSF